MIKNQKIPGSVKKLLLFLKFTNFYKKFIKEYLNITTLLINLTKNNILWMWGYKKEKAFNKLKEQFNKGKILISFNALKEIIIEIDILDYVIRVVIS